MININKLKTIYTDEYINRITIKDNYWIIDLHGLKVREARSFIKSVLLFTSVNNVKLIHGYNHGTALKEMISCEQLTSRSYNRVIYRNNPGLTELKLA